MRPSPISKLQQIRYISLPKAASEADADDAWRSHVLAISTEDGRVIFYSTTIEDIAPVNGQAPNKAISTAPVLGQLGGEAVGVIGRIKDFMILNLLTDTDHADSEYGLTMVTGSSDGIIRLWQIRASELVGITRQNANGSARQPRQHVSSEAQMNTKEKLPMTQIGRLLGKYETGNRITCLTAFLLVNEREDVNKNAIQVEDNPAAEGEEDENNDSGESD